MKNWTIAKRITAGGATLLVLLLVVSAVAVTALSRLERFAGDRLRDDAIPCIVDAAELTSQSLRGYIRVLMAATSTEAAQRDANIAKSDANIAEANKAMDHYEASITDADDRKNFEELKKRRDVFKEVRASYLSLLKEGKTQEAQVIEHEKMEPAYLAFREQIAKLLKWNQDEALSVTNEMVRTAHRTNRVAATVAIASLLVGLGLGWIIIRSTNRALRQMASVLNDASGQVASAANQVSVGSQSLAEGSSEQAASLEESSSSLEELSAMTKRNADSAGSAKLLSGETRAAADAGNTDMIEMRQAMEAIKTSSNDIAKIIKTIDEIAFQTNILALNAAVEAARAGEAGAGFAVVADEVRALAQRSANSAKETASKIEVAIHNGDHGARASAKVAQSLDIIMAKARKVDELVAEIASASSEQNQGISQINTAVSQMDQVTQSNAANAEETAAAAEELTAQSVSLKETVGLLRLLVGGGDHALASPTGSMPADTLPSHSRPAVRRLLPSPNKSSRNHHPQPVGVPAGQHDNFFKNS